jgi:GH25 family lysozyme M1 (1,4-beta-N-acetylmuramidase)
MSVMTIGMKPAWHMTMSVFNKNNRVLSFSLLRIGLCAVFLAGFAHCQDSMTTDVSVSSEQQFAQVCAAGPTLKGIDVSDYQGTVDWAKVKADGNTFAFARISDGVNTPDDQFASNWPAMKAAGVVRGAYQLFRPGQSAEDQANLFLTKLGTLEADDLPPVIDVEVTSGQSPAVVAQQIQTWLDIVESATGRKAIIYANFYFWRDDIGNPSFPNNPLWIAAYVNDCPDIPSGWNTCAFWQYTEEGSTDGVNTPVDSNRFNGDLAALMALTDGGAASCGDKKCSGSETTEKCPSDCPPCGVIPIAGGIVDDGDACFVGGGDPMYLRRVTAAGADGDLLWTYATDAATEVSSATWNLYMAQAGRYKMEVYTDSAYANSKKALYAVRASGNTLSPVAIDQSAFNGW